MIPIPCKNCLIFPLCKAQVHEYINNEKIKGVFLYDNYEGLRIYRAYCRVLEPKCSILYDWLRYTLKRTPYKKQMSFASYVVDSIESTFIK